MDLFRALLATEKPEIVGITETWIHTNTRDFEGEFEMPGYITFKKDRLDREGGGVMLYVRGHLDPVECKIETEHEIVGVVLNKLEKKLHIYLVYRPPHQSAESDESLYSNLSTIIRNKFCIVAGDFNCSVNWKTQTADAESILGRNIAAISSITNIDDHFKAIKSREEAIPLNFETLEDIYYNQKFTEEEFEHALSNCSSSAPGSDNISFDMIKNLAPLAKTYLLQFYNHLWVNQIFPKVWKHAVVIPISKPGKDPSNPNNYRPISLTSCLCKLMEKMVNNRLNWVLRKNKVLSPTQCGSQAERSTLDSLSHLENHIRRGFERKQITVAIFFDIQKAYDTTWRYLILKSLHHNGFRGICQFL